MAIKRQTKISSASIVPGVRLDLNPFQQRAGTARLLQNWIPERNRLTRKCFAPKFHTTALTASGVVWDIIDFRFHRNDAPQSQLLIFRSDGKIYRRTAGSELEIFPGTTSYAVLNARPGIVQFSNRLFFSDLSSVYVYDGRSIRPWGIARPTAAPVLTAIAGTDFAATDTVSASITWVIEDETGTRVHESSCSDPAAFLTMTNPKLHGDISALTPPAHATHWSFYVSELTGSSVRRRAVTTAIATKTVDVTYFPASNAAEEPVRNDPPDPSTLLTTWRNRIAMRDELDPRKIWFTAFGEVKATNAGAAEESVCGRDGATSISDLINEFRFPDHRTRLIAEHENYLICFTESNGYYIVGTGGIIDDQGTRSMTNEHIMPEGAAGSRAGCSTPYGFAWMTQGRKINLFAGTQVLDIGYSIQPQLNTIPETNLGDTSFYWWNGNGRKQLLVAVKCAAGDTLSSSPGWRGLIYDFDLASEAQRPGEWFEWSDHNYTVFRDYLDGDHRFLLGGDDSGDVYQMDTIVDPAHLSRSMILGQTYLGSTLQNNPAATMRTGIMSPADDYNATGLYLAYVRGSQDGPSTTFGSNPTLKCAVDVINPDAALPITLTSGSVFDSGEYYAWLKPDNTGVEGGALAKQFQFEASYAAGASNNGEIDTRYTVALECLYKLSFSWQQQGDIKK